MQMPGRGDKGATFGTTEIRIRHVELGSVRGGYNLDALLWLRSDGVRNPILPSVVSCSPPVPSLPKLDELPGRSGRGIGNAMKSWLSLINVPPALLEVGDSRPFRFIQVEFLCPDCGHLTACQR